jgi:hypothetical protein
VSHARSKEEAQAFSGRLDLSRWSQSLLRLLSEPQWTSEPGFKGLSISVRTEDGHHRELILEYPFPRKSSLRGTPKLPQSPKFSVKNNRRRYR